MAQSKSEKIAAAKAAKSKLVKNGEVIMTQQDPQEQGIEAAAEAHDAAAAAEVENVEAGDEDEEEDEDEEPIPEGTAKATFAAEDVYEIPRAELMAAVEAGDLEVAGWKAVTIGKGKSGTGKAEFALYEKLKAITKAGSLFLSKGIELGIPVPGKKRVPKGELDFFDYGFDLEAKRPLRKKLAKAIAGPSKEIAEAVKVMLAHKLMNPITRVPYTEAEIREMIVSSRAASGMTV